MYSLDSAGLIQCYIAGLPFLKYTLAGDLFWSVVLFGSLTVLGAAATPRAGELSAAPDEDLLEEAARLPLRLGELQADRDHAVVGHRMGHELDRPERDGVVRPRRVLDEIEREVIGERRLRVLGRNLEAVDFAERPERDLARHEEILDQIGVGGGRRRPFGEEAVERLHADRAAPGNKRDHPRGPARPPPGCGRGRHAPPTSTWPMTA